MAQFIPIEEFISKYEKQYDIKADDYSEFKNSFSFRKGNTDRSKNITYTNSQKGVVLNVNDMFHVENSKYDKLNVLCKSENNKTVMAYVISALECFSNKNCNVKDLYQSDSFDFYPFEVNCEFAEAYNFTIKLSDIKDKTILKHFIEKLVDCKYELKMHSISKHPNDTEKLIMRFILNIHVPLREPLDYNQVNFTAFQVYINETETFICHLEKFMRGKNLSIFPFLYIMPKYLEELCILFNNDFNWVKRYLVQKISVGGTKEDFDRFCYEY